ncbi:NUDIX domain-containing protein [Streptomyces sp. G-5]|uniref:NUDIX domain-containing protein n=1 Tax=Streptomyces sp. G-5 TaxID=2977231 RepID=UPI0021D33574|nr:NUDIX hydrolase [Streptomyces sp. G-5]MCU4750252.1 NUDIX hydrolase [Streptomyces sp. G-5]
MHGDVDFAAPPPRRIGALALIRSADADGAVLVVEKRYRSGRERYGLVGGGAHGGESAAAACAREVLEETGLTVVPRRVLAVHYMPARSGSAEGYNVVFDCGTVDRSTPITLPPDELVGYRWLSPDRFDDVLAPYQALRVRASVEALSTGRVLFLEGHPEVSRP